ncbi:methyltransferase domain-containing protein [Aetokthonos hydrillicola Thurmond2011]|jgi:ubiquinone/menaquinone biosynthesis C-methylase UbiE|uniref:Methyltransferase domain-containing protein n=1 Tax=Aetokthonos hydrillicola Thurmond2011 TaxID=2712845 RepID=A0AAP5M869_9CYAN|nr:class I SAM-dependent methyltransferase [Aetokthonos hydrillicola]MBO3460128.1 class I SAM-dependent methyltransferase [Aetokthonos hydrillicola CCALA 1050]MBW4590454.1 methyltransferase domain-containing protein [Aetokthonos hydrillicola CCALA 1050]MDR9892984.1 methyltransferase domain-containing protein [Aetokthonos hydrillicola Thurmond2011]
MAITLPSYDPTLFQGAAWYYARYRSKYPQALFDLLANTFKLDGKGRLLDLGCGAGLVAIPFANRFAEVVGLDPDADMLKEAEEQATIALISNIRWIHDRAESISEDLGKFQLVTMGRSFHWMQREFVLSKLDSLVVEDGGIVILKTNENVWESEHPWKKTVIEVVKRWLGDRRRTGQAGEGTWKSLEVSHEEILLRSPFSRLETYEVKSKQSWTIDSYLGYIYSTAFGLPSFFGENREKFETDLRASLLAVEPSGEFTEELPVTALVARRQT